jgi:hypothetical protein
VRRFEDEEDEESYEALRERERRQAFPYNYAEEYCSTTDYGDLVLQQRFHMVHWIVEVSETMRDSSSTFKPRLSSCYQLIA